MTKHAYMTCFFLVSCLVSGCDHTPEGGGQAAVVHVEEDDAEMSAAIATAQETFGFFEANWKTMPNDGYSLKFALPTGHDDGALEHIWFSPTEINGDQITGECANDPENIPGLKLGETRTVARSDISDWMIVVGNQCYGGYTIRVLATRDPALAPPLEFVDPPAK